MRFVLALLLIACASPAGAQAPGESDPRVARWLDRAEALLERGGLERAGRLIERASERAPGEPRIVGVLAKGLPASAEAAEALSVEARAGLAEWTLSLADALDPPDPAATRALERLRAWARALRGEHEEALRATGEAAGVHDQASAEALRRLAALFVRRSELGLAQRALTLALRAWSRDPILIADLAAVEVARGRPREAVRLLGAELVHRPDHRLLREDLAGSLLAAGRPADALRLWRALAGEAPDDGTAGRMRRAAARAGLAAERYESARVEARRALGLDPSDGEARLLLGLALVGLERPAHARTALERARQRLGASDLRVSRALEALEANEEAQR